MGSDFTSNNNVEFEIVSNGSNQQSSLLGKRPNGSISEERVSIPDKISSAADEQRNVKR